MLLLVAALLLLLQGQAGAFVKTLTGCYFNVVGFPLHRFTAELRALIEAGTLPL